MEYGQQLGNIQTQVKESNRKIEDLAYIIKSLTYTIQESGIDSIKPEAINRIETGISKIARSSSPEYIELFLQELRKNLDEKQRFLGSKVTSLEELMIQIGEFLNRKAAEFQNDKEVPRKLDSIKSDIGKFSSDFNSLQTNFSHINKMIESFISQDKRVEDISEFISELMPFLEKFYRNFETSFSSVNEKFSALSSLISKFDSSEEIKALKTEADVMNTTLNAVLSAIQLIDFKYKDIQDSFSRISSTKDIQSLQSNINNVFERINALNEVLKLVATGQDVDILKKELDNISSSLNSFRQDVSNSSRENKEFMQEKLSSLDGRFESVLSILTENKDGTVDISDRVNEIYNKFDGFQEILLKLLALDNVDLVKKDIREVFVRLNSISEKINVVSSAKSADEIKEETRVLSAKVVELRDFVNTAVLDNLKVIASDFSVASEKTDQILSLVRDDSQLIDLRKVIDIVDNNIRNTQGSLAQLSQLSKLDDIIDKINNFPDSEDILSIKEDLNLLVNQISKENDKLRGDLFSLQDEIGSFVKMASAFVKIEDLESLTGAIKESENNLKTEVVGMGDRFLEFSLKANEVNFGTVNTSLSEIKGSQNDVLAKLEYLDVKGDVKKLIDELVANEAELKNKFEGFKDTLIECTSNINDSKFEQIKQSLEEFKEGVGLVNELTKESIISKIDQIASDETIVNILEEIKSQNIQQEIKDEIKVIIEKISTFEEDDAENYLDSLKNNLDELKTSLISEYNSYNEELKQKIEVLNIKDSILEIQSTILANKQNIEDKFDEFKLELRKTDSNNVDETLNEIKTEISLKNEGLADELDNTKNILIEQLNSVNAKLLGKISEINVDALIGTIIEELKSNKLNLNDEVGSSLDKLREESLSLNENTSNLIKLEIDSLKGELLDSIRDNTDAIAGRLEEFKISDGLSGELKNLEESLKSELVGISDKILEHQNKSNQAGLEELKNSIQQVNENIKKSCSHSININENIDSLKKQIEELKASLGEEVETDISEYLDKLENKISNFENRFVELSNIQNTSSIEELLNSYSKNFEKISTIDNIEELKGAINQLGEQSLLQMVQFFENISFVEEAEDIKGYIGDTEQNILSQIQQIDGSINKEKFDSIIEQFNDLGSKIDSIESLNCNISELLNNIKEEAVEDEFSYSLDDVQSDFAKMRLTLHEIAKALSGSYFDYDLSSHIQNATEHIDKISGMVTQGNVNSPEVTGNVEDLRDQVQNILGLFEKLNTDVYDISMRTNKLILSSEDSNSELKNNLQIFKEVIDKSNPEKIYDLFYEISHSLQELKAGLVESNTYTSSSYHTNKTIKDSLIHIGEWADGAGSLIEETRNDISHLKEENAEYWSQLDTINTNNSLIAEEVSKINEVISSLQKEVPQEDSGINKEAIDGIQRNIEFVKNIISAEVAKIDEKFDKFDERFANIENKLYEVQLQQTPSKDDEIKPILEYIASQASAANENAKLNNQLLRRIENMETKVTSFEQDIKKLVSFVEED